MRQFEPAARRPPCIETINATQKCCHNWQMVLLKLKSKVSNIEIRNPKQIPNSNFSIYQNDWQRLYPCDQSRIHRRIAGQVYFLSGSPPCGRFGPQGGARGGFFFGTCEIRNNCRAFESVTSCKCKSNLCTGIQISVLSSLLFGHGCLDPCRFLFQVLTHPDRISCRGRGKAVHVCRQGGELVLSPVSGLSQGFSSS